MMKIVLRILLIIAFTAGAVGCTSPSGEPASRETTDQKMVKKRRDDGTLSSVNPVDDDGFVHGVKVNYYEDGTTVHSRITYEHGRKHGPAIWYFKSGKIYEHTTFIYGRKNGLTKRYYESGVLMEEVTYDSGQEVGEAKRYDKQGNPVTK